MDTQPAGTVRNNTDKVELTGISGDKIELNGVQPLERLESTSPTGQIESKEISSLHFLEASIKNSDEPRYTIDWLANVNDSFYLWPDTIVEEIETAKTRSFLNDGPVLKSTGKVGNRRRSCVKICIGGFDIYLGTASPRQSENSLKKGFILYTGNPPEEMRGKIRNCLSFFLGMYLVYLGYSTFDSTWKLTYFKAISGYSLDKKVFNMSPMPPAHLGGRGVNEINSQFLSQMVNALFLEYDYLNFTHLSWLYWHAVCAPIHAVAVLIGAAIEALQKTYIEKHQLAITKLLNDADWNELKMKLHSVITDSIKDSNNSGLRAILLNKLGDFNRSPQNIITDRVFDSWGLKLGTPEQKAWKQRNDGAHGNEVRNGDFVQLIRDNKLLIIRFHKMLLCITGASDNYYDYYTVGYLKRNILDPIE